MRKKMKEKKLIVLEGNCGDDGVRYKIWLEKNLPKNIILDFRERQSGVGGGMFDENMDVIENEGNKWWDKFCDECEF